MLQMPIKQTNRRKKKIGPRLRIKASIIKVFVYLCQNERISFILSCIHLWPIICVRAVCDDDDDGGGILFAFFFACLC